MNISRSKNYNSGFAIGLLYFSYHPVHILNAIVHHGISSIFKVIYARFVLFFSSTNSRYWYNRGHSESFLPMPETRLLTMQICGCAERKFACLKTDWERFIPKNIFLEENQSSADLADPSFLSFFPEAGPTLFCVRSLIFDCFLAVSLLFPCCFPAAGSNKPARR